MTLGLAVAFGHLSYAFGTLVGGKALLSDSPLVGIKGLDNISILLIALYFILGWVGENPNDPLWMTMFGLIAVVTALYAKAVATKLDEAPDANKPILQIAVTLMGLGLAFAIWLK